MDIETPHLKVGILKDMIKDIPDETEVFIRCCRNPCGNIVEAGLSNMTEYKFFGIGISCIIIEPANSNYTIK